MMESLGPFIQPFLTKAMVMIFADTITFLRVMQDYMVNS